MLAATPFLFVTSAYIPSYDAYLYLSGAEGLAAGHGYRAMGVMANKYPPLYSILLACLSWLPWQPMVVATALNAALQALGCLATYLFLLPLGGRLHATLAAAMVGLCNLNLSLVPEPSTHHLYLLLQLLSLTVASRALRDERPARRDLWTLGGLIGLAVATRAAAVALVAGLALAALFVPRDGTPVETTPRVLAERVRKRWPLVLAALVGLMGAVAYTTILKSFGPPVKAAPKQVFEGVTYLDEMRAVNHDSVDLRPIDAREFLERVQRNAVLYTFSLGRTVVPASGDRPVLAIFLAILATLGFARRLLRAPTAVEWFLFPYTAMLLAYPAFGEPYLIPATPFLFHYVLELAAAMGLFVFRACPAAGKRAALVVCLLVVAAQTNLNVTLVQQMRSPRPLLAACGQPVVDFVSASLWAREHLPREAVLVATRAAVAGYLAHRPAYSVPLTTDPDEQLAVLRSLGVTHAIVAAIHRWTHTLLLPLVRARPGCFEPIHAEGACTVYRVRLPESSDPTK